MATRRPAKGGTKSVRNLTPKVQSVFDKDGATGEAGLRYDLQPHDVREYPVALADLFLQDRAKYVVEYEPVEIPSKHGEEKVWIANATGNPMLPEKIWATRVEKGKVIPIEIPNPLRVERVLSRIMQGDWTVVASDDGSGKESRPGPQLRFDFPPFKRFYVSRTYAEWNLRRDATQEEHMRGQLIECAEPRDFEPNDSWSLTRLQAYVECLGYHPLLAREDLIGQPESTYPNRDAVEKAKNTLLRALFFSLLEDISVPDESSFESYYKSFVDRRREAGRRQAREEASITKEPDAEARPTV